jgi:hypothetical protein
MAIRDRLTVKTKDGTVSGLVVNKQGGAIDTTEPKHPKQPNWIFEIQNKEGETTGERLVVPDSEVVYISYDKEPKPKK